MAVKQTHSVVTDALATLGTIIDNTAGRDAIHLAVEPVTAAEKLFPGQDVGLTETTDGVFALATDVKKLGIVDPFLKEPVYPGQMFWLVVYPRQITSLRHVWEHPAFPEGVDKIVDLQSYEFDHSKMQDEIDRLKSELEERQLLLETPVTFDIETMTGYAPSAFSDEVAESKAWIERYCASIPLAYDVMMDGAADWIVSSKGSRWGGNYLSFGGLLEGEYVPDEFWDHYSIVTGVTVSENERGNFFSCSC